MRDNASNINASDKIVRNAYHRFFESDKGGILFKEWNETRIHHPLRIPIVRRRLTLSDLFGRGGLADGGEVGVRLALSTRV